MKRCLCYLALTLLPGWTLEAQETFVDPDKAGPEFLIQGEYEGLLGQDRLAAQVVAEGKGQFIVYLLSGGLPGAGWDGKPRLRIKANLVDGTATFEGSGWNCTIAGGKLAGKNGAGQAFQLMRVLRKSPTEGARPPEGALVLFDGTGSDEWSGGKMVEDRLLGPGGTTKKSFRDFKLHVEFRLPFKPAGKGQNRGNSGVYLQRRYEIQILDSFGLDLKNNHCGAIYEHTAPAVQMCLPPLSWQTFDIDFQAARFDAAGKKVRNAVITVVHNGVKVHDKVEVNRPTGHGLKEEDTPKQINLQNHGNPVYFRNIWLVTASE